MRGFMDVMKKKIMLVTVSEWMPEMDINRDTLLL